MRKENNTVSKINTTSISGYHSYQSNESCPRANSFVGGSKYFTSDRHQPLHTVTNAKGYAIEWEMTSNLTQNGDILATILKPEFERLLPANFFKYEHDSTVDIECVSQVGTKEFWRNHYKDFKAIYEYLHVINTYPNARIGASCGMHVNISIACFGKDRATQEKNIMKIHNLINRNNSAYLFMVDMLHRDRRQLDWCQKMAADYLDDCGSHRYCMNYSHLNEGMASRLEIRLVGAQQTYGNWRNTMEVIFHLVKKAKELSAKDFENPLKVWSGCNKYVYDRLTSVGNDVKLSADIMNAIHATLDDAQYI